MRSSEVRVERQAIAADAVQHEGDGGIHPANQNSQPDHRASVRAGQTLAASGTKRVPRKANKEAIRRIDGLAKAYFQEMLSEVPENTKLAEMVSLKLS